ncbi:MAG: hypothetical protein CMG64_02585 [Candidatus Marinimicrobia bacterium]|nr:hypothetical protein [Candidatus Neomarinimicrobiota bacterium]
MAELIIMFREVLEASLIIGILYTYLKKSNNISSIKMLWSGVFCAIIASIFISIIFQNFAGGFEGNSAKIFEGAIMIIASIVLTTMIIWMARNKNIAEDLENKAKEAISSGFKYGIFSLAFVAVFREGVEIILFLYSIAFKDGISIFPSFTGAFLGLLAGYFIFIQGVKVPLKKFFNATSIFLIFVSAGMLTYGIHELESGGVIPYLSGKTEQVDGVIKATRINGEIKTFDLDNHKKAKKWASRIWDINPSKNKDGSYPPLHDKGSIGGLFKGFFGYNGDPSLIEFITWVFAIIGLNYLYKTLGRNKKRGL